MRVDLRWAVQDSNLRPPACKADPRRLWGLPDATRSRKQAVGVTGRHGVEREKLTSALTSSSSGLTTR